MLRRDFLRVSGLSGAVLLAPAGRALAAPRFLDGADGEPLPQTGFEKRNGASWTTHEEELEFLAEVVARSPRLHLEEIGRTHKDLPLHLVSIGSPNPLPAGAAQQAPVTLFVCSQHGNEPAGRETGLKLLRDLAFTQDPVLVDQMSAQTVLIIPSANPDGRKANSRGNGQGVDINRDHLNLKQPESQALAQVLLDWNPDLVLDLHEYGPSAPVLYDDEILYLWPRNLNVDPAVQDLSRVLAEEYIKSGAEGAGYTADEYGLYTVDNKTIRVGGDNVNQLAGDEDEGICRNTMGLRHSLGILVESAVTMDPRNGPSEVTDSVAERKTEGPSVRRRRVASQMQVTADTLRFMRDQGDVAKYASDSAPLKAARSSRPVYFGGADNDPPDASQIQDPAPVRYDLTTDQAAELATTFALHGISAVPRDSETVSVSLSQPARPVIPLLLDPRGRRKATDGKAVYND